MQTWLRAASFPLLTTLGAMAVLLMHQSGRAEVLSTSAQVEIALQEFIDGEPASFADDREDFSNSAAPSELGAFGRLTSTDLAGNLEAMGQAFSDFLVPAQLRGNPGELAVEAACYSDSASASYSVESRVSESREVSFHRRDANFNAGGVAVVQSSFFVSGAILLWSIEPSSLENMHAAATLLVSDGDAVLLRSDISILAQDSGSFALDVTGPISARAISLPQLAAFGLDSATVTVLESIEAQGHLLIVVIPTQSLRYQYEVIENEPLILHAQIEVQLSNARGKTGVAATIGRPFSNLAAFMHTALPEVNGESVEKAVNKAIVGSRGPVEPAPPPGSPPLPRLCGIVGAETALLPMLFLTWSRARRRTEWVKT